MFPCQQTHNHFVAATCGFYRLFPQLVCRGDVSDDTAHQSVSAASIQLRTHSTQITVHGRPRITLPAGNPEALAPDHQFHSSACAHVLLLKPSGLASFNIRGSPHSTQNPLTPSTHEPPNSKPCSHHTCPPPVKLSGLRTVQRQADDFYPRPVLAFGYCRCLRVCVCVCVSVRQSWTCPDDNSSTISARITKFGPKM